MCSSICMRCSLTKSPCKSLFSLPASPYQPQNNRGRTTAINNAWCCMAWRGSHRPATLPTWEDLSSTYNPSCSWEGGRKGRTPGFGMPSLMPPLPCEGGKMAMVTILQIKKMEVQRASLALANPWARCDVEWSQNKLSLLSSGWNTLSSSGASRGIMH